MKADFTIDNPGGCSPLVSIFSNTSTGISANASFEWDFGNGNNGHEKDGKAIYSIEKTYTVKLTVKDGGQTSTVQKTVTVYKKPSIDFSFSPLKGCAPFPVTFKANATAGDGTISKYSWDFGDGNVDNTSNAATVVHSYTAAGTPPVRLTVVNSYGCLSTLDKTGIEVLPNLKADFDASATALCTTGQTVNFTNKSAGPGTLSYSWDLGGGKKTDTKDASNTYDAKGIFDVILIAKNAEGCADTAKKTGLINVANFSTDFNLPATICTNADVTFSNNSTPAANSTIWKVQEQPGLSSSGSTFRYTFPSAGKYHLSMTNTYGSCSETVTKEVTVKNGPAVTNFIADLNGACGAPITVKFKDTSQTAVSWNWDFGTNNATDNKKETSYTYNNNGSYYVQLTLSDAQGCVNKVQKLLSLSKPDVQITHTGETSGCPGIAKTFGVSVAADQIKSYEWDFGDGGKSTNATPSYVFNKAGTFAITLKYTTKDDCVGNTAFYSVMVQEKPVADFSINSTEICGSNPATFINNTTGNINNWYWEFGDGSSSGGNAPIHYYNEAGEYTVTLVAGNGTCRDTVRKAGYIKVLPPFPRIVGSTMSCKSGEVTFYQDNTRNAATKMWWEFGDGTTQEITPSSQTTVHVYDSSKTYKVYLAAENGACTVRDSLVVNVLLRQHPVLTATLTEVCGSGNLNIKISGLERSPGVYDYYSHYSIYGWQYADGTSANPNLVNQQYPFVTEFNGTLTNLQNGQSGIRVLLQANNSPGCIDTSNLIPLTIKGPKAKFSYNSNNTCFKNPIVFKDQSVPDVGVPIKTWEWSFGDGGKFLHADTTYPLNGLVSHQYAAPGYYYPVLTITDTDGCIGKTPDYGDYAIVKGPKANFDYYPEKVFPGTTVYFDNQTNYANSSPQFQWSFTNGTPGYTGMYPPSKTYNALGKDSITLIAKDPAGCTDTAIKVLYIKDVAASFTYTENYISSATCPPVIISFTSTSENAQKLVWDFGTGASDNNNRTVTNHTYYKPGEYRVVLYAYGNSTYVDSSVVYITIKGPYAILSADTLSGCLNQKVTLNADVKNASSFTWDFGDGSLQQTVDTFVVHQYTKAGIYTPALVLKDGAGCSGTSELPDKIVIDSLAILNLQQQPALICDSALVLFNPVVKSIAAENLQKQLTYKWDYGTGAAPVITSDSTGVYFYNRTGRYNVSLTVSSPYGCLKEREDSVWVIATPRNTISGPSAICQDGTALFIGNTNITDPVSWKWDFQNGNGATIQHPDEQLYTQPANPVTIQLITGNRGCFDTSRHLLAVHKRPDVNLTPRQSVLCLGSSLQLTAHDGNQYQWRPVAGLNQYNIANPIASPADNSVYHVEVTNAFGCKRTDSASITVAKPFRINLVPDTYVCYGNAVQLPAGGADTYQWVNTTTGLSSTTINAPYASPTVNTTYTVVGYDKYNCFTDTARVNVDVKPLPWVKAPENIELPTGSEITLPTTSSNDVIRWSWSSVDYLDCPTCPNPTSRPRSDIDYVVTVRTQFGCLSRDTVSIKLVCAKGLVHIPNAFTPNNDKINDVFYVKGRGIRSIKSMRVFNRWGEVVFETANVEIEDITKGWDGTYKGRPAPGDTYVYYIELICDTGEIFSRKGTITLIK